MLNIAREAVHSSADPFIIIYNYRTRRDARVDSPNRIKRHPHDYSQDRKSIIMTRKMKAELEHQ
jgi:hypothetical protein